MPRKQDHIYDTAFIVCFCKGLFQWAWHFPRYLFHTRSISTISTTIVKPGNEYMCHLTQSSLDADFLSASFLGTNLSDVLIKIKTFFAEENAFGIVVCIMLAILFRPQCVSRGSVIRENSSLGDFIVIRCLVGSRPSQTSLQCSPFPRWRHQMETFSALLAICDGNPPVTGGLPSQRPVMRSFDVSFDLRLN